MTRAMNEANTLGAHTLAGEIRSPKDNHRGVVGGFESSPDAARMPIRMLKLSQVVERTGLGKTSIYDLQKGGRFPRSVHVTGHSVRWIEAEVEAWLELQAQARISAA